MLSIELLPNDLSLWVPVLLSHRPMGHRDDEKGQRSMDEPKWNYCFDRISDLFAVNIRNITSGDGAPLPQAFLYGDGGCVEFSWLLFNGPAVTGRIMNSELDRISIPGLLLEI